MTPSAVFSLPTLHELNRRGIDHLAHAARHRTESPLSLVGSVRRELLASTPASRNRAAARPFLLLDLEFRNARWWQTIGHHPERQIRMPPLVPAFPRSAALPLTRATIIAAWRAVCADPRSARILMGFDETLIELFVNLPVTAIDPIAHHAHPHLRPRWADHPAFWRTILRAANHEDAAELSLVDVEGLQLLASEILISRPQSSVRSTAANPRNQSILDSSTNYSRAIR